MAAPSELKAVKWQRAEAYYRENLGFCGERLELFEDGISPYDVIQGNVGDCWLLAALAALAEYPEMLEKVFEPPKYSEDGQYTIRLFDSLKGEAVHIQVTDTLAVNSSGKLVGVRPQNELWVSLMEKAWCRLMSEKLEGGITGEEFQCLDGGFPSLALKGITGEGSSAFWRGGGPNDPWSKMKTTVFKGDKRYMDGNFAGSGETVTADELWETLASNDENRHLQFGAICDIGGEQPSDNGLVKGHAYSIISVKQVEEPGGGEFKLLKMRNPWGKFEWKGDWSDTSEKWEEHPHVEEACELKRMDDGIFWISFEDFRELFNLVEFSNVQCTGPSFDERQKEAEPAEDEEEDDEEVKDDTVLDEQLELFKELEGDENGEVHFKQFWNWLRLKKMTWVSRRDAKRLLVALDEDNSGTLSAAELVKVCTNRPLENEIEHRIRQAGGRSRIKHKRKSKRKVNFDDIFNVFDDMFNDFMKM